MKMAASMSWVSPGMSRDLFHECPRSFVYVMILLFVYFLNAACARPNFVILIADDLGFGDVGCFGNKTLKTPNIDSIARQGTKLSHHLAAASVCTPSRAAFLTGRYPVRIGLASSARNRVILFVASLAGLPPNETTFASMLKKSGYKTTFIGKWHLGKDCKSAGDSCHLPISHGFDYFYGLPLTNLKDFADDEKGVVESYYPNFVLYLRAVCVVGFSITVLAYRKKHPILSALLFLLFVVLPILVGIFISNIKIINSILMRNAEVIEQPIRLQGLTERLVKESEEFLEQRAKDQNPFLLVLSFVHVHTALFPSYEFEGTSVHGKYGDCVQELDWGVGKILRMLETLHLKENTFVYFTSDNGGHVEEHSLTGERQGGYNGIFKGGKAMGGVEGGIRVPTVAMWPNKIPSGLEISVPTSQMDIFPTIMHIAGLQLPEDRIIDGKTILPLLTGTSHRSPHQFLFHYCGSYLQAVRYIPNNGKDVWKIYFSTPRWIPGTDHCPFVCQCYGSYIHVHDPPLLYNMEEDPSETKPIDSSSDPRYSEIYSAVKNAVQNHEKSLSPVPHQMDFGHSVWRPWMQPCCKFPYCSCADTKYPDKARKNKV